MEAVMVEILFENSNLVAYVDDSDLWIIDEGPWTVAYRDCAVYAVRYRKVNGRQKTEYMHRVLLGLTDPYLCVDHKDGNGLNNRRGNLRVITKGENTQNRRVGTNSRSGFKGVHPVKGQKWKDGKPRWYGRITLHGKIHFLGYFLTPEEAALAYDAAAREMFEVAWFNFPREGERGARESATNCTESGLLGNVKEVG